jgi:hypothetical protein
MRDALFQIAVPLAEMKSVLAPTTNSFNLSPETIAVLMFGGVVLFAIYVFMR